PVADLLGIQRYDPAADAWTEVARLDRGVHHTAAVVHEGRLFIVGGYDALTNAPLDRVQALDLATGEVRDLAPMPTPRGAISAVVLDGSIHVLGGTTDRTVATHEVYDPAADTWSLAAPMA